MTSVKILI